jgi:hypothetical protein
MAPRAAAGRNVRLRWIERQFVSSFTASGAECGGVKPYREGHEGRSRSFAAKDTEDAKELIRKSSARRKRQGWCMAVASVSDRTAAIEASQWCRGGFLGS